jgi:hypothetical protein
MYSKPFSLMDSSSPQIWSNMPAMALWASISRTDDMLVFTRPRSTLSSVGVCVCEGVYECAYV